MSEINSGNNSARSKFSTASTETNSYRKTDASCGKQILRLDLFSQDFTFRLPDGGRSKPSLPGCIMTFILLTSVAFYGLMQAVQLATYDETDIMVSSRDSFFSDQYVFSGGMMFAFGLTAWDAVQTNIEDPTIGTLKPYYKFWNADSDAPEF